VLGLVAGQVTNRHTDCTNKQTMVDPSQQTPETGDNSIMYRHVGVHNATSRLEAGTGVPPKAFAEAGAAHAYTCWANQPFDETDPAAVLKWIKRVERSESYAAAVTIVCRRLETVLKGNNTGGGFARSE